MTNLNVLQNAMNHTYEHPETWDQDIWIDHDTHCGTTACVAGRIVLQAGYNKLAADDFNNVTNGEDVHSVIDLATELTEMHYSDAITLFNTFNDQTTLWSTAWCICPELVVPSEFADGIAANMVAINNPVHQRFIREHDLRASMNDVFTYVRDNIKTDIDMDVLV